MMRSWLEYPRTKLDRFLFGVVSPEHQWRLSLALAVAVHLLVLGIAVASPYLFGSRPRLPEIYTVNLFTVEETSGPKPARPQKAVVAPRKTKKAAAPKKPVVPKKAAPLPAPAKSAPAKALSTRPIRVKTKADLEKLKSLQESITARQKAKEAERAAQKKAREAVEALRQALQTEKKAQGPVTAAEASSTTTRSREGGVMVDERTKRYLIAVTSQIQEHWQLPDLQNWPPDLEAVVVIRVRRDGIVTDSFFEKKADNVYFNQFVEKTIREASPLPPFPAGLREAEMEIGLRFRPGEVL